VSAELNLSGIKPGEHSFDLTKSISVPDRLEVAQVVPSEIRVLLDTRATRWIPVYPRVTGTFPPGYRLGGTRSDPEQVQIIGPKKEVDAAESAITDPIDVSGALDSITVTRPAYVSDPLIQVIDPHPVRVTIKVEKENATP
jgi:YbbR domain-containing protein